MIVVLTEGICCAGGDQCAADLQDARPVQRADHRQDEEGGRPGEPVLSFSFICLPKYLLSWPGTLRLVADRCLVHKTMLRLHLKRCKLLVVGDDAAALLLLLRCYLALQINDARASICDTNAIVKALESGHLKARLSLQAKQNDKWTSCHVSSAPPEV